MAGFRARIAAAIESWAQDRDLIYQDKAGTFHARLDVLVWGGDDMTFVLPASHCFDFLGMMAGAFAQDFDAAHTGKPFAHRLGCVIAKRKTPIRLLKLLAADAEYQIGAALTDKQRNSGESFFTLDVFESSPLPFDSVTSYRRSVYGPDYRNGADLFQLSDAPKMLTVLAGLAEMEDGAYLAASQIYRALDAARLAGLDLLGSDTGKTAQAVKVITAILTDHFSRVQGKSEQQVGEDIFRWIAAFSAIPRSLPMLLAQFAQLRSYGAPRVSAMAEGAGQ